MTVITLQPGDTVNDLCHKIGAEVGPREEAVFRALLTISTLHGGGEITTTADEILDVVEAMGQGHLFADEDEPEEEPGHDH